MARTFAPREGFFHRRSRQKNDLSFFRFLRKAELCEALTCDLKGESAMDILLLYTSNTGFTKRYAQWIGE